MGISIYMQTLVLLYSVLVGAIIGVVFDVFRILRLAFTVNKVVQFIYDILFSIIATLIFILFLFYANDGTVRWFSTLGSIAGFYLYYNTLGRLIMMIAETIISIIKTVLRFIWSITMRPLIALFCIFGKYAGFALLKLKSKIKIILNHFKYTIKRYKMLKTASKCFGLDR